MGGVGGWGVGGGVNSGKDVLWVGVGGGCVHVLGVNVGK